MTSMRISQLAARTGVPATTLRFYEQAGLLPAGRTPAGYRAYGPEAVDRLAFIGEAKHLGLPLEEIAELLTVWEAGSCAQVKADLRPRIRERLAAAEARAGELAAFTGFLRTALAHLDALPDREARCGSRCAFLTPPAMGTALPMGDAPPPVACSLTGDEPGERLTRWRALLDGAGREAIPGGLRVTLAAERAAAVAGLAVAEQLCCPFFDFRLHLDGPLLRLEVRAPADGAGLLAELFGPPA
ncbi:MerR family transcriptional regulator [Spongiactinospora gelatinilytica]|uniref:MerR family transcriptional regulator n=1 Tax=Spongiactinospora gelatinilytica TaxID=2666298 RepID=A0A2W2I119_9ACTN|nr:MerR family transcriptional regulator [Spongiactinospora gelatinilytica]PZG55668.1 MerR family transcriptional regulator [Spongiactinospora gelatinilytica]